MLTKKEKRAAKARDIPDNSPAVIVIPERLVPGSSASGCAKAILKTCFQLIFASRSEMFSFDVAGESAY